MWEHAALEAIKVRALADEQAEAEAEKRERAMRPSTAADNATTRAFMNQVMGRQSGGALAEALQAAEVADAIEGQQRARCHSILDGWVSNQGGTPEQLRDLLGTRQHAVRADLAHQREDLRGRFQQAEARRSELERLCERQGNEITWLRSRLDRLEALAGGAL